MRIAAFLSHPIQYFSPLWREASRRPEVDLKVFYFSRHGLEAAVDPGFGVSFAWNIDLLTGYQSAFLPRQWPTRDPLEYTPRGLNRGLMDALRGADVAFVGGYVHLNNWFIWAACRALGVPLICFADTNLRSDLRATWPKALGKRLIVGEFVRRTSAFLAAGGQTRDYFVKYGAAPESVFICPYAVDVERFRASAARLSETDRAALCSRLGIPPDRRIVMYCGKLVDWKRPSDVVEAVRNMRRDNVSTVLVGDGVLRESLLRQAGRELVITGFVNQSEIPQVLSLADVLVLPSAFEPYGMVVSEAQCLGVPAVVSDACGCHGPDSVLQDGVSGFVYPTGDVAALQERLTRILDDRALRARMQLAARSQGDTQSQERATDGFLAAARYAMRSPTVG
jgi:glycosyltransferase involved in cell wall biosynthesis